MAVGGRVSLTSLSVTDLISLRREIETGRRALEPKEQVALLDVVLRVYKLKHKLEAERKRLAEGGGLGL